jgi:DNA-binding MarR family transcriptional regulator
MKELSRQELYLLFSHIPQFAQTFSMRPPSAPAGLPDMNMTHVRTLVFLRMHGAAPMSTVARWLNLEKGSFTPVARHLIDAELVECVVDEADRRRTLIRLTEAGKALDGGMHSRLIEEFTRKVSLLSADEQEAFFQSLKTLKTLLDKMNPDDKCIFPHLPMPFAQEGTHPCSD